MHLLTKFPQLTTAQRTNVICLCMSPEAFDSSWLILLAMYTLPFPPDPMLLPTGDLSFSKVPYPSLSLGLCTLYFLKFSPSPPLPHLTSFTELSLILPGSTYESCPWLQLSWHFTLQLERVEYSFHTTSMPGVWFIIYVLNIYASILDSEAVS